MLFQRHAEGRRHRVGGDVVVGGPDPAGGDDIVVAGAQGVQGVDDLVLDVGHGTRLAQVHPVHAQIPGNVPQIGVLGAAGQDLVTDDQHRRRHHIVSARAAHA